MIKKKMEILIQNKQSKYKIPEKKIEKSVRVILEALERPDAELSILIVDDHQMEDYNKNYLHRQGSTNVIAFPMGEGEFKNISPHVIGDVVISADMAAKEGKDAGIEWEERLVDLLLHGILHLLGFDHEKSKKMAFEMEQKYINIKELIEKS